MPVLEREFLTGLETSQDTKIRKQDDVAVQIHRFCLEHHRLMSAFAEAVDQLLLLHQSRYTAVVSGQPIEDRIDSLIERAKQKKEGAKQAYLEHTQWHRCA